MKRPPLRCALLLMLLLTSPVSANPRAERAWTRLQTSLDLTVRQVERLKPMLFHYHEQRRTHLKEFREQVRSLLTSDQVSSFSSANRAARCSSSADSPRSPQREGFEATALRRLTSRLGLTPEQQEQVRALTRKTRLRLDKDREDFLEEAAAILKPEQKVELRRLLQQVEERRLPDRPGGPQEALQTPSAPQPPPPSESKH